MVQGEIVLELTGNVWLSLEKSSSSCLHIWMRLEDSHKSRTRLWKMNSVMCMTACESIREREGERERERRGRVSECVYVCMCVCVSAVCVQACHVPLKDAVGWWLHVCMYSIDQTS